MLQNAYFLAKIGADTAENEQHFAEMFDPREPPDEPEVPARRRRDVCPAGRRARGARRRPRSPPGLIQDLP